MGCGELISAGWGVGGGRGNPAVNERPIRGGVGTLLHVVYVNQ